MPLPFKILKYQRADTYQYHSIFGNNCYSFLACCIGMHTKHLSRYFTGSFTTAEFHRYGITSCYRFTSLSLSVLSIQSFQFILCFQDTVSN